MAGHVRLVNAVELPTDSPDEAERQHPVGSRTDPFPYRAA